MTTARVHWLVATLAVAVLVAAALWVVVVYNWGLDLICLCVPRDASLTVTGEIELQGAPDASQCRVQLLLPARSAGLIQRASEARVYDDRPVERTFRHR